MKHLIDEEKRNERIAKILKDNNINQEFDDISKAIGYIIHHLSKLRTIDIIKTVDIGRDVCLYMTYLYKNKEHLIMCYY